MSGDYFQNMSKEELEALVESLAERSKLEQEPIWRSFDPRMGDGDGGLDWAKIREELGNIYDQAQPDTATMMRDKMRQNEETLNRYANEHSRRGHTTTWVHQQQERDQSIMTQKRAREAYFATLEFRCEECKKLVPAIKVYRGIKPTILYDSAHYFHVNQGTSVSCGPMTLEVS